MATKQIIDFSKVVEPVNGQPKDLSRLKMDKKRIRARVRRLGRITEAELEKLYKPVKDWDDEELARGRPRSSDGSFKGKAPSWISRQIHEEALSRFKGIVEGKMRQSTVTAIGVVNAILEDQHVDRRGRPRVTPSTKLEAAKFLLEHVVGKPTQRQEVDISVRLQALLANATAGPMNDGAENLALPPGADYEAAFGTTDYYEDPNVVDAEVVEDEDDD